MKSYIIAGVLALLFSSPVLSQVSITNDNSSPDPSAMLEVKSTSKGMLPPRMTTQERNAIESPAEGLLIFNSTTGCIDYYLGGSWKSLGGATEPAFQCGMKMTDPRDGKRYNTLKIQNQCWMAQNLNFGTRVNGTVEQTNNQAVEKYCYNDEELFCNVYGGLYQWGEVAAYLNGTSNYTSWNPAPTGNVKGICPDGWHLPSMEEWLVLVENTGGSSLAGGALKEPGTLHWIAPNQGGSGISGYVALPAGIRDNTGIFSSVGDKAYLWSSSETSSTGSWCWYLDHEYEFAAALNNSKMFGYSVRCMQD